jgi:S-(hydroxymethyl)glutathione dehydrogenase/alcohol dehydrogenase
MDNAIGVVNSEATSEPSSGAYSRRSAMLSAASVLSAAALSSAASAATPRVKPEPARKFRALVHRGTKSSVEQLSLLPISERQLVVRNEATLCTYTLVGSMLGIEPPGRDPNQPLIVGHGGVGIVEAVGPAVRRAKVGDRVIVSFGPHCGVCSACVRGRVDFCNSFFEPLVPVAETQTGEKIFQTANIGGTSEVMVPYEDWVYPVDTKVSSQELAVLISGGTVGLAAATSFVPTLPGANIVVLGAGLLGLSAIQGSKIRGASRIVVVEPAQHRRDLALKLGATHALDPNAEGDKLIDKIKSICTGYSPRTFAGGGPPFSTAGGDLVIEAVGGDRVPPKVAAGPDPSGVTSLLQAWEACVPGGDFVTLGAGQKGNLVFSNPGNWAVFNRTHHPSTFGGAAPLRDIPRFVRFIETGEYDVKSMITNTFALDQAKEAYQVTADRTGVVVVISFA